LLYVSEILTEHQLNHLYEGAAPWEPMEKTPNETEVFKRKQSRQAVTISALNYLTWQGFYLYETELNPFYRAPIPRQRVQ